MPNRIVGRIELWRLASIVVVVEVGVGVELVRAFAAAVAPEQLSQLFQRRFAFFDGRRR